MLQDDAQQDQAQIYDNTLKALFGNEAAKIIEHILPGAQLVGDANGDNIEIDRTTLKADLVYNTRYGGKPAIINLELQTKASKSFILRLLQYHIGLHAKYKGKPVISLVIYPFKTGSRRSPYEEKIGEETLLSFPYKELCLWKEQAEQYISKRAICMYTFLPAMQGATVNLLKQALREMFQYYTHSDFEHHLVRFATLMARSTTMSGQDKKDMLKEMRMYYEYDELIDTNPSVIKRVRKGKREGIKEGIKEGKHEGQIMGMQTSILSIVRRRFPSLEDAARQAIGQIHDLHELTSLIDQLLIASDEMTARTLLHIPLT